jgi:hypothetical protein
MMKKRRRNERSGDGRSMRMRNKAWFLCLLAWYYVHKRNICWVMVGSGGREETEREGMGEGRGKGGKIPIGRFTSRDREFLFQQIILKFVVVRVAVPVPSNPLTHPFVLIKQSFFNFRNNPI